MERPGSKWFPRLPKSTAKLVVEDGGEGGGKSCYDIEWYGGICTILTQSMYAVQFQQLLTSYKLPYGSSISIQHW